MAETGTAQALTPEEIIRQKLAQMLAQGKTAAPGQAALGGTVPPAPAAGGGDPTKQNAPTITPTTPQGTTAQTPATGSPKEKPPYQTDEEWVKQNPGAVAPLTPFKRPGILSGLAHGLAFGAMDFGKPGEGAQAEREWAGGLDKQEEAAKTAKANHPQTIHQARTAAEDKELAQTKTQAEIEKMNAETKNLGQPKQPTATPREQLEADYVKQRQANDPQAATTLDMLGRLYPKDFKEADQTEMSKIPPQVLAQSGPKPIAPEYAPPGQPPQIFNSTAEAQAAWGKHVQELTQKATSETSKIKPEVEAQIGPQPQREHFQPGPLGDKAHAAASKAWGLAAEKIENNMAAAGQNARGAAFGRNRPTQVLDIWNGNRPVVVSAGEAEDNPDRYVTQSGGQAALPKEALINDIRVSGQSVEKNLGVLDSKGFDRAALAAALGNPETTAGQYLQALPRGALDDNAQQFVTDIFNLREQAMALRSVLGAGAGSEDVRKAILATLPGIASPDKGFAEKQLKNLQSVLDRVERGVPTVPLKGGPTDRTPHPAATTPAAKGGFAEWDKTH